MKLTVISSSQDTTPSFDVFTSYCFIGGSALFMIRIIKLLGYPNLTHKRVTELLFEIPYLEFLPVFESRKVKYLQKNLDGIQKYDIFAPKLMRVAYRR